ncbi:UDP-N-acetylmuramyl pentapeptide phosphotransferase, partial [Lysinibacillus sp.]
TQAFKLSGIWVVLGQICAALPISIVGNLSVSHITIGNTFELGYLTIPFTILFLVGFTNVINLEKVHNPSILLLPIVSFVCLSILAYIMGNLFVVIIGFCSCLVMLSILLYSYFSGKVIVGRTLTTTIGFIIAVLSLSLIKASIVNIYIPIFTLALPFTLYYWMKDKFTSVYAITVSVVTAIVFSVLMFIVPFYMLWYFVVGLTILLVITQSSRKYRII